MSWHGRGAKIWWGEAPERSPVYSEVLGLVLLLVRLHRKSAEPLWAAGRMCNKGRLIGYALKASSIGSNSEKAQLFDTPLLHHSACKDSTTSTASPTKLLAAWPLSTLASEVGRNEAHRENVQ